MGWDLDHPLAQLLQEAAGGRFPLVDGVAELTAPDAAGTCAVVCFTGHAVVLSDRDPADLAEYEPDGYGAALAPRLLLAIADERRTIGSIDVVLVRRGIGGGAGLLERHDLEHHPRVRRAFHHRREVRVLADEHGLVTIGRGLVGRTELSVELTAGEHGRGAGRALIEGGLHHVAADEWVFAQVAAGNAASLRAFLACGFVPIGSEVLIEQHEREPDGAS
jgi:hypothetical protein